MNSLINYQELVSEIAMIKARLEGLEEERNIILKRLYEGPRQIKGVDYSGSHGSSQTSISTDRLVEEINRIDNLIYLDNTILEGMRAREEKITKQLGKLDGIDYKIAYKKIVENKTYLKISEEINLSHDRVRHIGSKIFKDSTGTTQTLEK